MSLVDVGAIIDDHEADDSDVAIAATSAATAAAMPSDTGARLPDNTEVELEFETFGEGDYAVNFVKASKTCERCSNC
jgi:hypothetical protein